ncbi:MAG: pyrroline-5-carboxylate reductase [Acidobacteria bacterium]|nr:MAG: pyrroline-5-carboxylate reductase [Acidobacteriota bacterium]
MEHKLGKIAVLGMGKMGGILVRAFQKQGLFASSDIAATVQHEEKAAALSLELGIPVGTDNRAAVRKADIIILGLKPSAVGGVLDEIRGELNPKQLIISIAASVPTEYVEKRLAAAIPVVRTMPNTPAIVGCGMTAICKGKFVHEKHLEAASRLFASVGRTVVVDEKHMDAITGLSASGPAYIYIILEALAEGGVKVGLPRDLATLVAAQTTLGAAKVALETGHHPALLKDEVTTPAGCTIDGIMELEEGRLRVTLIKAVVKAAQRARELLFKDSAVGA